jgi:hypothetical protein
MRSGELHIAQTTGWRALLTHAQFASGVHLPSPIEEFLVSLLYRYIGREMTCDDLENGLRDRLDRIFSADVTDQAVVGDQCLLFAGLLPDQAVSRGVPLSYFVRLGRTAYCEYGAKHASVIHAMLGEAFIHCMDTLQTVRALQSGKPCIDGLTAYHLWRELGSQHGWRVLRAMSSALPAVDSGRFVH